MILDSRKKFGTQLGLIVFLIAIGLQGYAVTYDAWPGELKEADHKLNICYKKILGMLNKTDQIKLKRAQYQWIVFRDLDCLWAYKAVPFQCLLKRTKNRTKELQATMFSDTKGLYSSIELNEPKK